MAKWRGASPGLQDKCPSWSRWAQHLNTNYWKCSTSIIQWLPCLITWLSYLSQTSLTNEHVWCMFHFLQSNRCRLAHMGPKELVQHHEEAEVVCCVGQLHPSWVREGGGKGAVVLIWTREEGGREWKAHIYFSHVLLLWVSIDGLNLVPRSLQHSWRESGNETKMGSDGVLTLYV